MARPDSEISIKVEVDTEDKPDLEPSRTPWTAAFNAILAEKYIELIGNPDLKGIIQTFLDRSMSIEELYALGLNLRPNLEIPWLDIKFYTDLSNIGNTGKNSRPQMAKYAREFDEAIIDKETGQIELSFNFVHGTTDDIGELHAGNFLDDTILLANSASDRALYDAVFSTFLVRPKLNKI